MPSLNPLRPRLARQASLAGVAAAALLALSACAMHPKADAPPVDIANADVAVRTETNGDRIEEYRVAGALRMVKVTPSRGAPYYMYDDNGDGKMDSDKDGVSPVYWKLYSW